MAISRPPVGTNAHLPQQSTAPGENNVREPACRRSAGVSELSNCHATGSRTIESWNVREPEPRANRLLLVDGAAGTATISRGEAGAKPPCPRHDMLHSPTCGATCLRDAPEPVRCMSDYPALLSENGNQPDRLAAVRRVIGKRAPALSTCRNFSIRPTPAWTSLHAFALSELRPDAIESKSWHDGIRRAAGSWSRAFWSRS
jgi:hypothetical protein